MRKRYVQIPSLPKSNNGKIVKKELRKLFDNPLLQTAGN